MNLLPLKMTSPIVLLLAILSITGQFNNIQCVDDHSVLIDTFNIDAINESNLVCYLSMYSKIKDVIQNLPNMPENDVFSTISKINKGLHRVTNWNKYLMDSSLNTIWANFINYESIAHNDGQNSNINPELITLVFNYATSLLNGNSINIGEVSTLNTPKGKQFFNTMYLGNISEKITELYYTFTYCSKIFSILNSTTGDFEDELINKIGINVMANQISFWNTYGYTMYLMTKDEFNTLINVIPRIQSDFINKIDDTSFVPHFAEAYLIVIIKNALEDMYIGMSHALYQIDVSYPSKLRYGLERFDLSIIHLKMITSIFYNIVNLTEELHRISKLYYVNEEIDIIISSNIGIPYCPDYTSSLKEFRRVWSSKVIKRHDYPRSTTNTGFARRLIKNISSTNIQRNKVLPSVIKYYSAYMASWKYVYNIQHNLTANPTTEFLLELNAWAVLLYQETTQLKNFLMQSRSVLEESPDDPDFEAERSRIDDMKFDIQQVLSAV